MAKVDHVADSPSTGKSLFLVNEGFAFEDRHRTFLVIVEHGRESERFSLTSDRITALVEALEGHRASLNSQDGESSE